MAPFTFHMNGTTDIGRCFDPLFTYLYKLSFSKLSHQKYRLLDALKKADCSTILYVIVYVMATLDKQLPFWGHNFRLFL